MLRYTPVNVGALVIYRIRYSRDGEEVVSTPWFGKLGDTIKIADEGMKRNKADAATITDDQGRTVWVYRRG